LEEKLTIDVLVLSISRFHPLLSYGNCPSWLPCPFLLGFAFGFLGFCKPEALGQLMGFLSRLWLSYCALVFVCLMQSINYMLWMKNCSMIFLLEVDFKCNKGLLESWFIFHICSGGIYHIELKSLTYIHESIF